ncbi:MFS transporter [Haladaptatus sp. NG-WS-4]
MKKLSVGVSPRAYLSSMNIYYGWIIAGACFLASFVVFGMTYSFSVFADAMMTSFEASRARISLVFGIHTFILYVSAVVVGGLVDTVGPRRMLLIGGGLLSAGLVGASQSGTLPALMFSYGVFAALGLSIVYVIAYATVPRWFGRRRGLANGLATSGLGIGLLTISPAASTLIQAFGWRTTYTILAVGLAAIVAVVVFVFADEPTDVEADLSVEFPNRQPTRGSVDLQTQFWRAWSIVQRPAFLLVLLGWICVYATLYVVMGHLVLYVTDAGMDRWVGVWAIASIGISTSVARLGLGFMSDRVGRVRLFVACSAVMGATTLLLAVAVTPLAVFAITIAFGLGYGGNGALLSPLVADLFGTAELNTLYGVMSLAFAISGLLAPPAGGAVRDVLGTYVPVFVGVGILGLAGAGCVAAGSQLATAG